MNLKITGVSGLNQSAKSGDKIVLFHLAPEGRAVYFQSPGSLSPMPVMCFKRIQKGLFFAGAHSVFRLPGPEMDLKFPADLFSGFAMKGEDVSG